MNVLLTVCNYLGYVALPKYVQPACPSFSKLLGPLLSVCLLIICFYFVDVKDYFQHVGRREAASEYSVAYSG